MGYLEEKILGAGSCLGEETRLAPSRSTPLVLNRVVHLSRVASDGKPSSLALLQNVLTAHTRRTLKYSEKIISTSKFLRLSDKKFRVRQKKKKKNNKTAARSLESLSFWGGS